MCMERFVAYLRSCIHRLQRGCSCGVPEPNTPVGSPSPRSQQTWSMAQANAELCRFTSHITPYMTSSPNRTLLMRRPRDGLHGSLVLRKLEYRRTRRGIPNQQLVHTNITCASVVNTAPTRVSKRCKNTKSTHSPRLRIGFRG